MVDMDYEVGQDPVVQIDLNVPRNETMDQRDPEEPLLEDLQPSPDHPQPQLTETSLQESASPQKNIVQQGTALEPPIPVADIIRRSVRIAAKSKPS